MIYMLKFQMFLIGDRNIQVLRDVFGFRVLIWVAQFPVKVI